MRRMQHIRGYTLLELVTVLVLAGLVATSAFMIGQRVLARYQLDSAARTLATDLERAKMRAIQTNSTATLTREADRRYRAVGMPRELPHGVRFGLESADSISFNGMGAVRDGTARRFVLTHPAGGTWEVRVFAGGGKEVRKL